MFQCASVRSSSDETPHNIIRGDQVGREACQEQGRSDYQTQAISRDASWSHRLAPAENVALFTFVLLRSVPRSWHGDCNLVSCRRAGERRTLPQPSPFVDSFRGADSSFRRVLASDCAGAAARQLNPSLQKCLKSLSAVRQL